MKRFTKLQPFGRRSGFHVACIAVATTLGSIAAVPTASAVDYNLAVSRVTLDQTGRFGGTTGTQYNLSCPQGRVLVGMNTRSSNQVFAVQGICRSINTSTGAWTGAESLTAFIGPGGGTTTTLRCPSGRALIGFSGRASSSGVFALRPECKALGANGTVTGDLISFLQTVGGTGGSPFNATRCTSPARAIAGRSVPQAGMVSIQFACETNGAALATPFDVDLALLGAQRFLESDAGTNDVSCDVRLSRSGASNTLAIEPGNGSYEIDSDIDFDRACNLPGFAVVVDKIDVCGGRVGTALGCARISGSCMVVVDGDGLTGDKISQLWAHEFGHTRGLPHRDQLSGLLIMNPSISNFGTGSRINDSECFTYLTGLASPAALSADASTTRPLRLSRFVAQTFIHGVPYDQARAYGSAAVPELISILRDPLQEASWSNAAVMLGMIGDQAAVEAVIDFIREPGRGAMTKLRGKARGSAVMALGYAAHQGNETALWYLMDSAMPGKWRERALAQVDDANPETAQRLTRKAMLGLALSGRAEALAVIRTLKPSAAMDADLLDTVRSQHAKVGQVGLSTYYRDADERDLH
ncbi:MAG: hypothetical protein ACT4QA_17035 [Panacagrimonas sp.]